VGAVRTQKKADWTRRAERPKPKIMIRVVSPGWQFTRLSEAEVMAALEDPNPGNAVAVEVARLVEAYTENFTGQLERLGFIPESFLRVNPQTAIEAVAMRLTFGSIQETVSAGPGHIHAA
jgi:hypothetical protein